MNAEFFAAIEDIEKEKGIPRDYMYDKIRQAMLAAFRRDNPENEDNVEVILDEDKKRIEMQVNKLVVEEVTDPYHEIDLESAKKISRRARLGETVAIPVETKKFGRIAAQAAKQVIIQGIREFERDQIYNEYQSRQHELLSCVVSRVDRRGAALALDRTEIYLVAGEQIPGEVLREGKRIKVYVVEVRNSTRGPQIMISRTHPGMVRRLFEMEVPEISSGVVEIKSVAREAGSRSKISVSTNVKGVDPIGACIGPRGQRVAAVVNELNGEKIDIVRWHEDPEEYVAEALAPADVTCVMLGNDHTCRAIVPDDQLSLAIGKEGQNARLAAKLTGWKIDIKPESELELWRERMEEERAAALAEEEEAPEEKIEPEAALSETEAAPEKTVPEETGEPEEKGEPEPVPAETL
jgi:N utilization substance protein A